MQTTWKRGHGFDTTLASIAELERVKAGLAGNGKSLQSLSALLELPYDSDETIQRSSWSSRRVDVVQEQHAAYDAFIMAAAVAFHRKEDCPSHDWVCPVATEFSDPDEGQGAHQDAVRKVAGVRRCFCWPGRGGALAKWRTQP